MEMAVVASKTAVMTQSGPRRPDFDVAHNAARNVSSSLRQDFITLAGSATVAWLGQAATTAA
jgi:hypothetical protein